MSVQAAVRCTSHHYMTGWTCQLDTGHKGPCLANAGPNGEPFAPSGKPWVYAWHQPAGEPACNQKRCANPNDCRCPKGRPALRRRPSKAEGR